MDHVDLSLPAAGYNVEKILAVAKGQVLLWYYFSFLRLEYPASDKKPVVDKQKVARNKTLLLPSVYVHQTRPIIRFYIVNYIFSMACTC